MNTVGFKGELVSAVSEDEIAWRAAGRRQFEEAYSADDSVYEQLIQTAP